MDGFLPLSVRIEAWTREAILTWGDDWARIAEHIERRMAALDAQDRQEVAKEAALTLIEAQDDIRH